LGQGGLISRRGIAVVRLERDEVTMMMMMMVMKALKGRNKEG